MENKRKTKIRAIELHKGGMNLSDIANTVKEEFNLSVGYQPLRQRLKYTIDKFVEDPTYFEKVINYKVFTDTISQEHNRRVLVIGDLHQPFTLEGYLEHCINTYKKYNCDTVVFIGDIVDSSYSSYHETDPDGMSGGDELALSIKRLKPWYEAFPNATVIIGNHCRMVMRRAFSSSIPRAWIKPYNEVLGTPNWRWVDRHVIDDVQYVHGEGGTARTKCLNDLQSTVQGHLHTQAYCEWKVGNRFRVFGMQIGCGIDHDSYAMAYAKRGKKPAIGVGVVLDGQVAINELMKL